MLRGRPVSRRLYSGNPGDCTLQQWRCKTSLEVERFFCSVKARDKIGNKYWSVRDELLALRSEEDWQDIARVHFPEAQLKQVFQTLPRAFFGDYTYAPHGWWTYGEPELSSWMLNLELTTSLQRKACVYDDPPVLCSGDPFLFHQKYFVMEPKPQISTILDYIFSDMEKPRHDILYVVPYHHLGPVVFAVLKEDMPVRKFYCKSEEGETLSMSVRSPKGQNITYLGVYRDENPHDLWQNIYYGCSLGSWFEVFEEEYEEDSEHEEDPDTASQPPSDDGYDPRTDDIVDDRNDV